MSDKKEGRRVSNEAKSEGSEILVYIAGPIHGSGVVEENVRKAVVAAIDLRSRYRVQCVVPHLNVLANMIYTMPQEEWLKRDFAVLRRCDAVWRLPGDSQGADKEVELAENLGLPVFFASTSEDDFAQVYGEFAGFVCGFEKRCEPDAKPKVSPFRDEFLGMQSRVHMTAIDKGWHEHDRLSEETVASWVALMHSELSEALEELRAHGVKGLTSRIENGKPEGFVTELADVVIRMMDACGALGLDLGRAIEEKAEFNDTREHRHGGKKI